MNGRSNMTQYQKINVCMIAYRAIPKDANRVKIAQSLNNNGYNVDFICLKEDNQSKFQKIDGINIIRVKNDSNFDSYRKLLINHISFTMKAFKEVSRLHKLKKYSYFHIHNPPDYLIFTAIPFKLLYRSKIILDLHDMLPESVASNLQDKRVLISMAKLIEKVSVAFSDAVISTNIYDKQIILSRNNISPDKVFVVMNTPDLKQFKINTFKKEDYTLENKFVLLFEGTIWKRRGIQTIIDVVDILKNKIPIYFLIVGDGPDTNFLKSIVNEKNLNNFVRFTGRVNLDTLSKYISISDLCTIPFLQTKVNDRGVPNKLFEYTIHEKPILASRLKGMSLTFSEQEILYYEPGNVDDAAKKIIWCYNNPHKIEKMVINAKKMYEEKYTWDKFEKELCKCYESII